MIKNCIFDFGNVLGEFYTDRLTAPFVQDVEMRNRISEVVFDRLYWDKLDEGTITDEEVKEGIRSRLPEDEAKIGCVVYDSWVETMTPVEGMHQLVCDVRKSGKNLYLLSNISEGFAKTYSNVKWIKELFENFDGLVLSGTIGKIKPNRDIFEHLLETYGLKAEECLFIDDNATNIKAAESVGIKGYLFDGDACKLRKYLEL